MKRAAKRYRPTDTRIVRRFLFLPMQPRTSGETWWLELAYIEQEMDNNWKWFNSRFVDKEEAMELKEKWAAH